MSESSEDSYEQRLRGESVVSNPDSYVGSRTASVFDATAALSFPKIDLEANIKAYKSQNQCFICETQLGRGSFNNAKKLSCKFCYNAVCSNCSPLTSLHQISQNPERICMKCYNAFIEETSIKKASTRLSIELEQAVDFSNHQVTTRKLLEAKCSQLEIEITEKEETFRISLEERIREITEKKDGEINCLRETANKDVSDLVAMISLFKDEIERMKEKLREALQNAEQKENENKELQHHLIQLNSLLKTLQSEQKEEAKTNSEISELLEFKKNSNKLMNEKLEEIDNLQNQVKELKKKIEIIQTAPRSSTCGCTIY